MPSISNKGVTKYRVRVEEYQTWTEYPTHDELNGPVAQGDKKPAPRDRENWIETDNVTTTSPTVMAGILRAKADELDPKKPVTRDYGA